MEFYHHEETNRLRRVVSWVVDVIVVIAFAWFVVYAYGTQIKIAGHSMTPLLQSEDIVLMDRLAYDFGSPKRFDVVVFQREDQKLNVKRVIGLPGETIQISGGAVYVNDQRLEAANGLETVSLAGLAETPIHLGEEEYFLLGDNRDSSEDSRFANIGNVRSNQIQGKVWLRVYPLMNVGAIRSE